MEDNYSLYENSLFDQLPSGTIRPGGLGITDYAMKRCAFETGAKLLDIGCGNGATVNLLLNHFKMQSIGIDSSRKLLAGARAIYPALELLNGDAQQLPFSPSYFDGVLMECTLSLMNEPGQAFSEAYRVLKNCGKMVLSDFYYRCPVFPTTDEGPQQLQESWFQQDSKGISTCLNGIFYLPALCAMIEKTGFKVLLWEDWTRALKELTAELIFKFGSAEQMWSALFPTCSGQSECPATGNDRKVGYFLALLQK